MPLLPPEPFVSPPTLFDSGAPAAGSPHRWWVLHTKPRAEKSLARRCLRRGLAYFLPQHRKQWRRKGRLFSSHLPLFPGYLFLYGDADTRLAALETNLVARCLPVEDQAQLYADLTRVHRLIVAEAPLTPEERLEPGDVVDIVSGPLAGLQGKVLRKGKQLKLLVEVQFLQRGVSAEIESWMLQPADPRRPAGAGDAPRS
jgi:transcription antitermination factor NusG